MDKTHGGFTGCVDPASSIMFYTGDGFTQWKTGIFVGALTTRQLIRI